MSVFYSLFGVLVLVSGMVSCMSHTTVTGYPRVVDADTLVVNGTRIRLAFLDAPEYRQQCLKESGEIYACGKLTAERLREQIGTQPVRCILKGVDVYNRALGTCRIPSMVLNEWLVNQGYAVAAYGRRYKNEEAHARQKRLGLWQGLFLLPSEWRRGKRL